MTHAFDRNDNVEIAHGTNVSRNAPEHPTGPIYLQGDHGSVAFRNLKITAVTQSTASAIPK